MTNIDNMNKYINKDVDNGCWLWVGAKRKAYGAVQHGGRVQQAHRVMYELVVGPIAEGLVLDHLCRVPACVRPEHLEPVTQMENLRRGKWKRSHPAICTHGHEMIGHNIIVRKSGGWNCRTCASEASRRYLARKKTA